MARESSTKAVETIAGQWLQARKGTTKYGPAKGREPDGSTWGGWEHG